MSSRIEIYDSKNEKTVIQPPAGYEFTGAHRHAKPMEWFALEDADGKLTGEALQQYGGCNVSRFILRPLPTPKEQRDKEIHEVLSELLRSFCHGDNYDAPRMINARSKLEAIFAEHPDKEKL